MSGAAVGPGRPALVKCLVWDLDNTLWDGTLAEGDAVELRHRVADVVTKLKFALDTVAFIDDQPAERAEMQFRLPQVCCYPAELAPGLADLPEFSQETVTVDSRRRRSMYQASFRRDAAQAEFAGPDQEFLRSLEMVMRVGRATEDELSRVSELTLRTSQMNATGVHYSDAVLRGLLADPDHEVLVITLADRFGPHGAVGVVLIARQAAVWHLKLLATSCRVVSFGAGSVILNWLIDQVAEAGCHLVADFRRTERNRMMEVAYRFAGFGDDPCACRAAIPAPADGNVTRLHIAASRQPAPATMRLVAPPLGAPITTSSTSSPPS